MRRRRPSKDTLNLEKMTNLMIEENDVGGHKNHLSE